MHLSCGFVDTGERPGPLLVPAKPCNPVRFWAPPPSSEALLPQISKFQTPVWISSEFYGHKCTTPDLGARFASAMTPP